MKKTFKKLFAVLLTALMLMSVMGLQSFAAPLDFLRAPTITSVSLSENSTDYVSLKEVKGYFDYIDEMLKEMEDEYGDIFDFDDMDEATAEMFNSFWLSNSNFDYEYSVVLSNGKTYTVKSEDGYFDVNPFVEVEVDAIISRDDYAEAVANKADTVKVTFVGDVFSKVLDDYTEAGEFSAEGEINTVSSVIKSITPVSGFPSTIYEDADYIDLDGAKVKIKYADGSTKTAEVEMEKLKIQDTYIDFFTYSVDGNELYVGEDHDEGILYLTYLDAEYEKKVTVKESFVKKVEITDYVFDQEAGLKSISYSITWANGKKDSYTKEISEDKALAFYDTVDYVNGYFVSLSPYNYTDEIPEEDVNIRIYVCVGEASSEAAVIEVPYADTVGFIAKLANAISSVIDLFKNVISVIVGMFV